MVFILYTYNIHGGFFRQATFNWEVWWFAQVHATINKRGFISAWILILLWEVWRFSMRISMGAGGGGLQGAWLLGMQAAALIKSSLVDRLPKYHTGLNPNKHCIVHTLLTLSHLSWSVTLPTLSHLSWSVTLPTLSHFSWSVTLSRQHFCLSYQKSIFPVWVHFICCCQNWLYSCQLFIVPSFFLNPVSTFSPIYSTVWGQRFFCQNSLFCRSNWSFLPATCVFLSVAFFAFLLSSLPTLFLFCQHYDFSVSDVSFLHHCIFSAKI